MVNMLNDFQSNTIKQAVLLAGGMGTRLKPFTDDNPKPMYPVGGRPFMGHLLDQIESFGIKEVILLLGYKAEKIQDYVENEWKNETDGHSLNVVYDVTPVEYDTGARIKNVQNLLQEDFLLMYCDNYCTIDFTKLCNDYFSNNAKIQLTAYENKDGYTKDNLIISEDGCITCYDKKRVTQGLSGVDIGYAIVSRECVEQFNEENENFEKITYPNLVNEGKLFATVTKHRYYSVGSWERIELTKAFFDNQKTIFLDRDGTLNVRPPKACYVESPEDFVWLPGAVEAIKLLKERDYRIIIVSNQPGIARGNLTEETLHRINAKMQDDLKEQIGREIDDIFYCPHNWDEGCECRKPKPGMFFMAQKKYSINLTKCYMIGDDERDIEAAEAAGMMAKLVDDQYTILDAVKEII